MITLPQLEPLLQVYQETIPASYLDKMGHMNVRYYVGIFDEATWRFFTRLGMDPVYFRSTNNGMFALEQHIRYLAEVCQGETVIVHARLLGRSTKRIHFMHFMINATTGKLAATLEVVGSHVDTSQRRSSPIPEPVTAQIDAILIEHGRLDWAAPICGVMRP